MIFKGHKKVELRRVCPKLQTGDLVVIYVSSPVKALKGAFKVKKIIEENRNELWAMIGPKTGINRDEFDQYFQGAKKTFAIEFEEVWELDKPISLDNLRKVWQNFRLPQNYYYLDKNNTIPERGSLFKLDEHFISAKRLISNKRETLAD